MLTLAAEHVSAGARDLVVVLAAAGIIALLFNRLRISTIPGYLIGGAIIGPHALRIIQSDDAVRGISQLSTILLMFIIGLELDMSRVKKGIFSIIGGTILATGLMIALGWAISAAFVQSAPQSLAIAMAMAITATAAPLRTREQRRELHTTYGRLAFGILLFQDLLAVGLLTALPALALWHGVGPTEGLDPQTLLYKGAVTLGGLLVLIVAGKFGLPRLLAEASRVGGEVLIVVSAAVALASAVFSAWLGFSPELGAFLAGFLLASTPFRFQLSGQLIPMRDLFLAVFFTAVGLSLPVRDAVQGWWIVGLGLIGLTTVKIVGITFASWALGASLRIGLLAATAIAPAGEFTLVMLSQALDTRLLTSQQVGYCVAIVVMSILVAPMVAKAGRQMAPRVERVRNAPWVRTSTLREDEPTGASGAADGKPVFRAIIAGFGPVGRAVADALQGERVDITVIELNPNTVQRQVLLGRRVVYGDASNPEVLLRAGMGVADAVILTMPDEEAMLRACRTVRAIRKDVFIAARANALSKGLMAMQLGADHAVVEEMATAEAMGKEVLMKVKDRIAGMDTGPRLYEV